jgi:ABC transport system ATP-binding/permease protein
MSIQEAERSGSRVIVAKGVSFGYGAGEAGDEGTAEPLIRDFSTTIMRGDKIGLIGPNGVGKTTLIQLLLGRLEPDAGTVEHGTSFQVQYFDQHREQLDEAQTVAEAVGFGSDHVELDGERRHVMSYLQDFLFSSERARQPVSVPVGWGAQPAPPRPALHEARPTSWSWTSPPTISTPRRWSSSRAGWSRSRAPS